MSCQNDFINSYIEYNTQYNRLQPRRLALGHNFQQWWPGCKPALVSSGSQGSIRGAPDQLENDVVAGL